MWQSSVAGAWLRAETMSRKLSADLGVFQGSCRVNRLTMPLLSRPVVLDPGSAARCRSVPSYAFDPTTIPAFALWHVRTTMSPGQDLMIQPSMPLSRCDEPDAAMSVIVVVPPHEIPHPSSDSIQTGKTIHQSLRAVFQSSEQRL